MGWLRCKLSFAAVCSSILCIKGRGSSINHLIQDFDITFHLRVVFFLSKLPYFVDVIASNYIIIVHVLYTAKNCVGSPLSTVHSPLSTALLTCTINLLPLFIIEKKKKHCSTPSIAAVKRTCTENVQRVVMYACA